MSEQTITLQSVLAYIDGRIETLAGDKPYVTSRAEELMKARAHFAAMVEYKYTVTFVEKNKVSGVSIQVYSDPERTTPVGTSVATDASGKATIDLVSGTYYFVASKESYQDEADSFDVDGDDVQVAFEMEVENNAG